MVKRWQVKSLAIFLICGISVFYCQAIAEVSDAVLGACCCQLHKELAADVFFIQMLINEATDIGKQPLHVVIGVGFAAIRKEQRTASGEKWQKGAQEDREVLLIYASR